MAPQKKKKRIFAQTIRPKSGGGGTSFYKGDLRVFKTKTTEMACWCDHGGNDWCGSNSITFKDQFMGTPSDI